MARVKQLYETQIKSLKPREKEYKVADGDGLYLHITPNGSKIWRIRLVSGGLNTVKSLGAYPLVGLKEARAKRDEIRALGASYINIFRDKKNKVEKTFDEVFDEYISKRDSLSEDYISNQKSMVIAHIVPFIGNKKIQDIEAHDIVNIISKMNDLGIYAYAKKAGALLNRIFKYATTMQYIKYNPMSGIDTSVIVNTKKQENFAHTTDENVFKDILKSIFSNVGDSSTRVALMIAPFVFVRPSNIRFAEWVEFDFDKKIWTIPAKKMKMDKDHIVPLTDKMIEILKLQMNNGSIFVFPSVQNKNKPLSENTMNKALSSMGYKGITTVHGFRHTASTLLHENIHIHGVKSDVIEMQLAHTNKNKIKATYNKAMYIPERIRLMQWWSDYLDSLLTSS